MTQLSIEQKLSRARTQLLLNQPFFGTLCLRLKLVPMPSFPTMATDGRRLAYNAAFVEKLTATELEGVLAHEVMHCALAHHCRRGDREAQLWNRAADYAVNPILIGNGMTLPKDALIDPSFADLSAEEIYARLMKQGHDSREARARSNRAHTRQLAEAAVTVQGKHHKLGRKRRNRRSSAITRTARTLDWVRERRVAELAA
jgi:predicted metal-dependent peptidase